MALQNGKVSIGESTDNDSLIDTSHNGIVVTITSARGGVGKTTVAALLAAQLSKSSQKAYEEGKMERPLKVCLVDLNTFDSQLEFLLGIAKPTSLNIALSKDTFGPELVYNNLIYSPEMKAHALLAPIRGVDSLDTGAELYRKVISSLREMFDIIIIDSSINEKASMFTDLIIPETNVFMYITRLDIISISSMKRWIDTARTPVEKQGHGISMKKVGIVVNQSSNSLSIDEEKLAIAAAGAQKLVAIPLDESVNNIYPLSSYFNKTLETNNPIATAFFSLAEKLTKNLDYGTKICLSPLGDDILYESNKQTMTPAAKKKTGWFTK